jgi:FkbM family methyltransferase
MKLAILNFYFTIRNILRKVKSYILPKRFVSYIQDFQSTTETQKLGSVYGSKSFVEAKISEIPFMVSLGVGEDISFEIEFLSKYGGEVYLFDPTPRSEKHINNIYKYIGQKNSQMYALDGQQPVTAYNLEKIKIDQLKYYKKAAWIRDEILKFYSPKNENWVSHSLVRGLKSETPFIHVEAIDIVAEIIRLQNLKGKNIDILKIDIEGAEVDVLHHLLNNKVYPLQIIVEYDKLSSDKIEWIREVERIHERLIHKGYKVSAKYYFADFSYLLEV